MSGGLVGRIRTFPDVGGPDRAAANGAIVGSGFFFSSRRRHTRFDCDWSSDVCSSDLEIYFSILQRKVLTPNDFKSLGSLKQTIYAFQERFSKLAQPFKWKFTRDDLRRDRKSVV